MTQCVDCHFFAPWHPSPSGRGVCDLQLPPWAQTHEDTDRTVSSSDSCDLGRPRDEVQS